MRGTAYVPGVDILWHVLIWGLIALGLAGAVLPFLPGTALVLLAAGIHKVVFGEPSLWTLAGLALIAFLSWVFDILSSAAGAKWFGATRYGAIGALIGGVIGLFFNLPGIIVGPIVGAFAGEVLAGRKAAEAGKAGVGTAVGGLAAMLGKLAATIVMIVWFAIAVLT
jgi:uncharacterized protein YqgC (DUF456 family)